MSESHQNLDGPDINAWRKWLNHWRFSNQTSFRVADDLKRATDVWLSRVSDLDAASNESFIFVRHPINKKGKEKDRPEVNEDCGIHAVSEFTQSTHLAELLSVEDGRKDLSNIIKNVEEKLNSFAEWLLENEQSTPVDPETVETRMIVWRKYISFLKQERQFYQHEIDYDTLEDPKTWKTLQAEERPRLFGNLYLAFSLGSHKGFLADNLNEWHLMNPQRSPEQTLGYAIKTDVIKTGKLPDIPEAWVINQDGSTVRLNTPENPIKQKPLTWLADIDKAGDHPELLQVGFELIWELFGVFNELEQENSEEQDIYHYVVPAFSWAHPITSTNSSTTICRAGMLVGWVFYRIFDEPPAVWPQEHDENAAELKNTFVAMGDCIDQFAEDYLSGETEWMLERPWEAHETPSSFMQRNFFHSCGWDCKEITSLALENYYEPSCEGDDLHLLVNLTRKTPHLSLKHSGRESLVAKIVPNSLCFPPPEAVRNSYLASLAKHTRHCYVRIEAIFEKRKAGQQSGRSTTFHDYSKDFNVLEDQLQRYSKDIKGVREELEQEAQALLALDTLPSTAREAVDRMVDQAKRLGDPNLDFMLRLQFLMSHLRLKTEGRLYEAPAWCWQLLESGTKRDIYLILRALVWRPFGWAWYDKRLKSLPESTLTDDSATWSRIFLFEEDREETELRTMDGEVRRKISEVFAKVFFRWDISKTDYEASFPPPAVNDEADWDDRILWRMDDESRVHHQHWLPPVKLLPLFVFAMRSAFEHAFLRNFLHVLDVAGPEQLKGQKPRAIRITESKGLTPGGARIHHRIHIAFPALGLEPDFATPLKDEREPVDLPYDNWTRHMNQYLHVARPWKWFAERVPGSIESASNDLWHYEITLEARE